MDLVTLKEAREQGLPTYFTGEPCNHGHIVERYVSWGTCVVCARLRSKRQRESNPEGYAAYQKQYRRDTIEERILYAKEYRQANKETLDIQRLAFREANRERLAKRSREYYWNNREAVSGRVKAARPKFLGRDNALSKLKKARKLQATPPWADLKKIQKLYELAAKLHFHVDHIIPLRHPLVCGLHVHTNLRVTLSSINMRKHNKFSM